MSAASARDRRKARSATVKPALRADPDAIAQRVEIVRAVMARGQWLSRVHPYKYASEWSVSPQTVHGYATTASRMLWDDREDVHLVRANTIAKLEVIAAKAEQKGELRSAIAALHELSIVSGAAQPTKYELSGPGGAPLNAPAEVQAVWAAYLAGDAVATATVDGYLDTGAAEPSEAAYRRIDRAALTTSHLAPERRAAALVRARQLVAALEAETLEALPALGGEDG